MADILIIRNGEISIKGQNRRMFEKRLIDQLKLVLREHRALSVKRSDGRIHIDLGGEQPQNIIDKVKEVFGVVSFSPAFRCEGGYEELKESLVHLVGRELADGEKKTFKVHVKRQDKSFPKQSPQMSRELGGVLLRAFDGSLSVDVVDPQLFITVEFKKEESLVFWDKIKGPGGLPVGINGKSCILLSGGIDSPVAAYLMSKRGLYIDAVHFHSFPFTNERSQDKVMDLAAKLAPYTGKIRVHMVNLLPIQQEISANCKEEFMTILSRRFMMSIAERIALENGCNGLITGESLGQVASQTAEGLLATNDAVETLPVFRPLIAFDKEDIIDTAKRIGTYEISIVPEEDCCTVFLPKNPATKPRLEKVLAEERKLERENLIREAIEKSEIREVRP